jgi:hypothetical protein
MASHTSAFGPATVPSIPPVPGLPVVGNLLQFRRDRLGLQDLAARTGPIARIQLVTVPAYVVTDADSEPNLSNLDRWYERDQGERHGKFILYRLRLK